MIYKRKMGQPDPEISTSYIKDDVKIYQDSYNTFLNKNIANPDAVSINNTQSAK